MGKILKKCAECNRYSIAPSICLVCGGHLRVAAPPKFSPQDKYGKYRRILLKDSLKTHQNEKE
ncbi:MAG: RNA-protein complex protein Nop10 [Promethearchaeota archaeon]